jgi:serine/threonine protein kinase
MSSSEMRLIYEIDIMSRLEHPNIARLSNLSIVEEDNNFKINLTSKSYNTNMRSFFRSTVLPYSDRLKLIFQLGSAIDFLHDNGIIHNNISPNSIIIELDKSQDCNLILTDFSSSTQEYVNIDYDLAQKENYRAPEYFYRSPNHWPFSFEKGHYVMEFKDQIGFPGGFDKKEKVDIKLGEIWTFGFISLLILYNIGQETFLSNFAVINDQYKKVFRTEKCKPEAPLSGYYYFSNILSMYKEETPFDEYIINHFGPLPYGNLTKKGVRGVSQNEPLFSSKILSNLKMLVTPFINQRQTSLANFLSDFEFEDLNLIYNKNSGDIHDLKSIPRDPEQRFRFYNQTMRCIKKFYKKNKDSFQAGLLFLAVEMFHRFGSLFIKNTVTAKKFGITCLYMVSTIFPDLKSANLYYISSYFDMDNFDHIPECNKMMIKLIKVTNGIFFHKTLYQKLSSLDFIMESWIVMKNREFYEEVGEIDGIYKTLINHENPPDPIISNELFVDYF